MAKILLAVSLLLSMGCAYKMPPLPRGEKMVQYQKESNLACRHSGGTPYSSPVVRGRYVEFTCVFD